MTLQAGGVHTGHVAFTLTIDCGGGGIKGSVLDEAGTMRAHPLRVPTPYPLHPDLFVKTLVGLGAQLPNADRVAALAASAPPEDSPSP